MEHDPTAVNPSSVPAFAPTPDPTEGAALKAAKNIAVEDANGAEETVKAAVEIPIFGETDKTETEIADSHVSGSTEAAEIAQEIDQLLLPEVMFDAIEPIFSEKKGRGRRPVRSARAESVVKTEVPVAAEPTRKAARSAKKTVAKSDRTAPAAQAARVVDALAAAVGLDASSSNFDTSLSDPLANTIEQSVTEKPVDGIEILIKLAESGDIDAKNIDIIDVTDKFLKAIAAAPKENLRQSGRIIFHASVLLRMKAEALLAEASAELDISGDDFIDFDDDLLAMDTDQPRQITLKDLEKALVRRTNNKQNRQRKVTLQQLIDALKDAEKLEKERLEKKPRQRIQTDGYIDVRDVEDILELAHDEDIEVTIAKVDQLLEESIKVGDALSLLKLIRLLGPKSDWVDAFLAILFLSNAGKIVLEQEEFYGPVHIVRAEPIAQGQAFKVTGVDHSVDVTSPS